MHQVDVHLLDCDWITAEALHPPFSAPVAELPDLFCPGASSRLAILLSRTGPFAAPTPEVDAASSRQAPQDA